MFLFSAAETGSMQERIALLSTSTVHAPHGPRPQPNRGPCSSRLLRRTYKSGVLGSASTTLDLPFTFSEIRAMVEFLSRWVGQNLSGLGRQFTNIEFNIANEPLIYTHSQGDGNTATFLQCKVFQAGAQRKAARQKCGWPLHLPRQERASCNSMDRFAYCGIEPPVISAGKRTLSATVAVKPSRL